MTRAEARGFLQYLVDAYPNQKRDAAFIATLAQELVLCPHPAERVAQHLVNHVRTSSFFPSIAEALAVPPPRPPKVKALPPPPDALPNPEGLNIFRQKAKSQT